MKVSVIGAGSWGTALAALLASKVEDVILWARKAEVADAISDEHANPRYLSHVRLPENLRATVDLEEALEGSDTAVIATPSANMREILEAMRQYVPSSLPIAFCSKGVEAGTGLLLTQIGEEVLGGEERLCVLSGPTHAEEVIEGKPSACVCASADVTCASFFQELFAARTFRAYVSMDPVGVELCGAFKNVIAIAVGISYGLGFGDNTAAMIVTRGLAEMSRMVVACGGSAITCMGLAGAGDMVVTCMSRHSRNRVFGEDYVAKQRSLEDFQKDTHMVVEGAIACRTLEVLAKAREVELPITDAVRSVVWEGKPLEDVVDALVGRPLKEEFYGM